MELEFYQGLSWVQRLLGPGNLSWFEIQIGPCEAVVSASVLAHPALWKSALLPEPNFQYGNEVPMQMGTYLWQPFASPHIWMFTNPQVHRWIVLSRLKSFFSFSHINIRYNRVQIRLSSKTECNFDYLDFSRLSQEVQKFLFTETSINNST